MFCCTPVLAEPAGAFRFVSEDLLIAKERQDRRNADITVPRVRVIEDDGSQVGIMMTADALKRAQEAGLDLVEVSPNADPPVCKIMDFGKFKYEEKKKEQARKREEARKKKKEERRKTGA